MLAAAGACADGYVPPMSGLIRSLLCLALLGCVDIPEVPDTSMDVAALAETSTPADLVPSNCYCRNYWQWCCRYEWAGVWWEDCRVWSDCVWQVGPP